MNDHQLLDIIDPSDKSEIRQALLNKISGLDFEIDIERIFSYILCAQRLSHKTDIAANTRMTLSDTDKAFTPDSEEIYNTPEKLIAHFTTLYNTAATRFNKSLWQAPIQYIKENDAENLHNYCEPIAGFLLEKPFLRSEILRLLANSFPFSDFFPNPELEENKDFWTQYGYIYNLLRKGNIELDLLAHTVEPEKYTPVQLDDIYNRVLYSARYYREKKYAQAFNVLSEGIPAEAKPLMVWQREVNILYKAAFIENEENVAAIFEETLNTALLYFPADGQLLYMRAKFILRTYAPEKAKDAIIEIVKLVPDHEKCLFILGKSYMQLGISRAASIIFENLTKFDPLNMEYVVSAAMASRAYIDFCIEKHDPKDNSKQYYINMISELVERHMFEEAAVFARQAPQNDLDISALIIYAVDVQTFVHDGTKDKEALLDALLLVNDKQIRRKIKEHYLKDIPSWAEVAAEKKFIQSFYQEYPTDAMANYHMGMYLYATENYKQAYEYFLKAKEIAPSNITIYYNLARAAAKVELLEDAIQHINVYLLYNKYHLQSNELYSDWTFALQQFDNAHESAQWTLSICRTDEFKPLQFFYFTAGLSLYLKTIPKEKHNTTYILEALDLFDQYPKPSGFWAEEEGLKSMYWAAKLCYYIDEHEKCVSYIKDILKHAPDHNNASVRLCLFELLPQSLYTLQKHEELIEMVSEPALALLAGNKYVYQGGIPALFLSIAHGALGQHYEQMQWALKCVYCYLQTETPPLDWIEKFLEDKFSICIDNDVDHCIIPIGAAYIDIIKTININHIWMAHNMANMYAFEGNPEQALNHHRKCLEYAREFPGECEEETTGSEAYIHSL